jgi:protein-S-isoprenylcysteine O-methyltransferase Ste14
LVYDDAFFRSCLIAGLAVVAPIGIYHRIRSQATGEKLDRRQEGLFLLIAIRLFGLAGFAGLAAYLFRPEWLEWSAVDLPPQLRFAGLAVGGIGAALLTWTFHHLGKNLTDTVVTRREHTLVTSGPYRWVRHPFYGTAAILIVAGSLITANGYFALVGGAALLLLVIRTDKEEAKLIERFGDAYRRYIERTGRFFPRFGG